ncbi:uncharacterized protein BDW43DRAFT_212308 [Aspergillus alliaceus]|uniref:uncharacterized protein n=1 Tax=Petromyces alliaceus TaxID=209559 RepID=UPI0012A5CFA1|nr:uncharacterized protein BDW43DRAFT_212308 [Aspergillus alliaceus]KAB8228654.1 hypothetical protein BDW43DRAFT_212308 [Aspergillus alliaceus]
MAHFIPSHIASLHRASGAEINKVKLDSHYYEKPLHRPDEPQIPKPQLFQPLASPNNNRNDLPTISECAAHLELLEVFHTLRERVLQSTELDNSFGIKPNIKTVYRKRYSSAKRKYESYTVSIKDNTFQTRRKQKWPYFLELAVGRFVQWIKIIDGISLSSTSTESADSPLGLGLLPPVDVLMVWHAFLLNPNDFNFYCVKHRLQRMREASLPWLQIHEAINSRNWSYSLPKAHGDWLQENTQVAPDLFQELVEIGKKPSGKYILSEYRSESKGRIPLSQFIRDLWGVSRSQISFAQIVEVTRSEARKNSPLVENVERQLKFAEKMHAHLWIRSPAVEGTIRRAIDRYEKFLQLFRDYPDRTMVPTLDVDLAWHTHLCSPEQYRASLLQRTGRMVNHDDKLGKSFLHRRFDKTHDLFSVVFGQQYHVCLCWDCEAISSAMEAFATKDDVDIVDDFELEADDFVQRVEEDVHYHRAVEIARRKGITLPVR